MPAIAGREWRGRCRSRARCRRCASKKSTRHSRTIGLLGQDRRPARRAPSARRAAHERRDDQRERASADQRPLSSMCLGCVICVKPPRSAVSVRSCEYRINVDGGAACGRGMDRRGAGEGAHRVLAGDARCFTVADHAAEVPDHTPADRRGRRRAGDARRTHPSPARLRSATTPAGARSASLGSRRSGSSSASAAAGRTRSHRRSAPSSTVPATASETVAVPSAPEAKRSVTTAVSSTAKPRARATTPPPAR